ncbi:MAG: phosphonate ABC transporter, permease protein PhnE [Acidimicrobiia bacterium]
MRPEPPKRSPWIYPTIGAVAAFTVFAARQVGFSIGRIVDNVANAPDFLARFWPPPWDWVLENVPGPFLETIQIAVMGTLLGCAIAMPLAFLAAQPTAPNPLAFLVSRSFMNVIRTMPDLFWAMLFVVAVGFNAFAGALALLFFSLAIMAKLFSETVDAVDPGPLEAARAAGAGHAAAVQAGVLPQVLPNYVAYALYIFEINIRASVVLGLVGAGGIGRVLEAQRAFFRFDRIMGIVVIMFVIVILLEQLSVSVRRRLV